MCFDNFRAQEDEEWREERIAEAFEENRQLKAEIATLRAKQVFMKARVVEYDGCNVFVPIYGDESKRMPRLSLQASMHQVGSIVEVLVDKPPVSAEPT